MHRKGFREVRIGTATGTYAEIKAYTMYKAAFGTRR